MKRRFALNALDNLAMVAMKKKEEAKYDESVEKSLEFGHESNSTSRPRSEDVVNLDYGK
ncbi:hypothetical protein L195_g019283, partial [Trifolium pratense]